MRDWAAFVRDRLRLPALAPEREARIVREIAAQLEDFYRDGVAAGMSPDDADSHARQQVGDWERLAREVTLADRAHARPRIERLTNGIEDRARNQRGGLQMLADTLRDARYAIRQLARAPGFAMIAVLTLAVGIGATSAMFSVVNGVLLKPFPVPESDRLVSW